MFEGRGIELTRDLNAKMRGPSVSDPAYRASGSLTFTVCHYAGNVIYNADGWLQKDQNALPADAVNLLLSSSNEILVQAVRLVTEASATQNVSKGKGKSTVGMSPLFSHCCNIRNCSC